MYSTIRNYLYSHTVLTEPEAVDAAKELRSMISEKHKQHIRGLEATLTQRNQTIQQLNERVEDLEKSVRHRDGLIEDMDAVLQTPRGRKQDMDWYELGWKDALAKSYVYHYPLFREGFNEHG